MIEIFMGLVFFLIAIDIMFALHSIRKSLQRMEQLAEWQAGLGVKKIK